MKDLKIVTAQLFRFFGFLTGYALLIISIQGCQSPKNTSRDTLTSQATAKKFNSLKNFVATGKVGFSDGKKGGNANIQWEQLGSDYRIRLYGPLGSGSIQIVGQSDAVYLIRSTGQKVIAKTPEALVRAELGCIIPVSGLRYWLRGIPAPGIPPTDLQMDEKNQELRVLKQQGWTVYYQAYQDIRGLRLPYRLTLENGPLRLKFIFNAWDFS